MLGCKVSDLKSAFDTRLSNKVCSSSRIVSKCSWAEVGWRIGEGDQDVDVAVRAELLGEYGAEERKLLDMPLPAEAGDALLTDRDGRFELAHVSVLFIVKPLRHCCRCRRLIVPSIDG
jgi:hypothetical protein